MRSTPHPLITFGSLLLTLLLIAPAMCLAQKRGDSSISSSSSRRDNTLAREAELQRRELRLRLLNEGVRTVSTAEARSAEGRKIIVNQIFEDFERIQLVNREMIQVSANLDAISYKRVSTLAEEMNKRAKRLKTNLNVPDVEHEKKGADNALLLDATQLKTSLQTISASVKSFVSNPLFQDPRVTDVRYLDSLRRDIVTLIDLSRTVKKSAARLGSH